MNAALLIGSGRRHESGPDLPFLGGLGLAPARMHEFCGDARHTLALMLAARMEGPIFWISLGWRPERLNAEGMWRFIDPGRLTLLAPNRPEDVMWCTEEVLRSGAVPLIVADLPEPPGLTPVRRLQLAAETGAALNRTRSIGLLLTPGDGGAAGTDSRWRLRAAHRSGAPGWSLTRLRARTAPPKSWQVIPGKQGFELTAPDDRAAPAPGNGIGDAAARVGPGSALARAEGSI